MNLFNVSMTVPRTGLAKQLQIPSLFGKETKMRRSNAIHCATLVFTLGLALPLAADDTGTDRESSNDGRNDRSQISRSASLTKTASSATRNNGDVKFLLVCDHGACGSRQFGGGYAGGQQRLQRWIRQRIWRRICQPQQWRIRRGV